MTTVTWYPHPARPEYEISDEGGLRTVDGEPVPLQRTPNGSAYYKIPAHNLPGEYIHVSPDHIIDDYVSYAKSLVSH